MKLAKIVSYVLHPVVMPLLGVFIIFNSGIYVSEVPAEFKRFVYTMVLLCTVILPLTLLPALYLFKAIQKFTLDERRERLIPLFFTTLCCYLAYFLIARFSPIGFVNRFLLAGALTVFAILVVTIFWKISIHLAGLGGIAALIVILSLGFAVDLMFYLAVIILALGMVSSARLALNAHKPLQLLAGFLIGFFIVGGVMYSYI